MAIFPATISMVDAYSRTINKRVDINAADYATALTNAASYVDDLQALTEAEVLYYSVATKVVYAGTLTAGANKDEGLTLSVRTTDNEKATIKVPAPKNEVFNTDGSVDTADALITNFIANYTGALVLVDDGETVTGLLGGRLDK
jgi:hypothetical protein